MDEVVNHDEHEHDTHEDAAQVNNETATTATTPGTDEPNPFAETPTPVEDAQAEHDKREAAVEGVVTSCSAAIAGLVDADGLEDHRAINLVMLRLRNAFGG